MHDTVTAMWAERLRRVFQNNLFERCFIFEVGMIRVPGNQPVMKAFESPWKGL